MTSIIPDAVSRERSLEILESACTCTDPDKRCAVIHMSASNLQWYLDRRFFLPEERKA